MSQWSPKDEHVMLILKLVTEEDRDATDSSWHWPSHAIVHDEFREKQAILPVQRVVLPAIFQKEVNRILFFQNRIRVCESKAPAPGPGLCMTST